MHLHYTFLYADAYTDVFMFTSAFEKRIFPRHLKEFFFATVTSGLLWDKYKFNAQIFVNLGLGLGLGLTPNPNS